MRRVRRAFLLLSAIVVATVAPCAAIGAQPAQQTSTAYQKALDLEQADKYAEAVVAYREALAQSPGSVPVILGLERAYAQIGRTDSMLPVLNAAIARNPREAVFRVALLRSLRTVGDREGARVAFEKWRADWPRDPVPYREYSRMLMQDGQTTAVDTLLRRAQAEFGSGRGLEYETALLRSSMGMWPLAAESWRAALRTNAYLDQAAVHSLLPAPRSARAELRQAFMSAPVELGARKALAALEVSWGSPREGWLALKDVRDTGSVNAWLDFAQRAEQTDAWLTARDALVAVLTVHGRGDVAARAANDALAGGDAASSLALAQQATLLMDARAVISVVLGTYVRALAALGRADDAQKLVVQYAPLLAPDQRARLDQAVAWAWVKAGDVAKARALLADAAGQTGEASGWLALYDGDLKGARTRLKATSSATPELLTALALLERSKADSAAVAGKAFLDLARGDTIAAATGFERAAQTLPDAAPLVLAVAARLYGNRHDVVRSVALWKGIVEKYPEAPEAPEGDLEWGRAMRRQGNLPMAIERLEHLILTYPQSALVPQARRELDLARATVPPTP